MEKLIFMPNTPVQIALKYAGGKPVDGQYGPQVYFTLAQPANTCVYLDQAPAELVNSLGVRAGEPFWMQKVVDGRKGSKPTWDAWFDRDRRTALTQDLKGSLAEVDRQIARITGADGVVAPAPKAVTRLEDALKTVVAAIHATNEYAKSLGYAMPQFTSEDIRTMANTIIIGGRP